MTSLATGSLTGSGRSSPSGGVAKGDWLNLSRGLDGRIAQGKGRGYTDDLLHFAISDRFGVNPDVVLNVWDEEMYDEAIYLMRAEARYTPPALPGSVR